MKRATPLQLAGKKEREQNLTRLQWLLQYLNPLQLFAKRDKNPTPLQLLVKEMPGKTFLEQYSPAAIIEVEHGKVLKDYNVTNQKCYLL